MLATVSNATVTRKPGKIFNAHLFDEHGYLSQDEHGQIIFTHSDTFESVEVEPTMVNFLTVQGEVGLTEAQRLADERHGGAAWICTHRAQEVA